MMAHKNALIESFNAILLRVENLNISLNFERSLAKASRIESDDSVGTVRGLS